MLNVGVHMLSLAGEHLLVQICFMFHFLFDLFVVCVGSGQHHPEGRGEIEAPFLSRPESLTGNSKIYTLIKQYTPDTSRSHTHTPRPLRRVAVASQ